MRVVFVPGIHSAIGAFPVLVLVRRKRKLWLEARLPHSARYELWEEAGTYSEDQMDWNKLGGVASLWGMWRSGGMTNKAMATWRWVPSDGLFHLGVMWHGVDGARVLPEQAGMTCRIAPGQRVSFVFYMERGRPIEVRMQCPGRVKDVVCEGTEAQRIMRTVVPYFGGNKKPPKRLSLDIKRWVL